MSAFIYFFLGLLVIVTLITLVVIYYVRKSVRFFKRMTTGNLTDEEFQRMTDKYYSSKKKDEVHFDDDYFKGKGWQRKSGGCSQSTRRTTRTDDGVTIVDNRDPNAANKKIFAQDEGEYVDFTEE